MRLSAGEIEALKAYKLDCDEKKMNLKAYEEAYKKSQSARVKAADSGVSLWVPVVTFLGGVVTGMVVENNER